MRWLRKHIAPMRLQYLEYRLAAMGGIQTPDRHYMRELTKLLHPVDFVDYRTEHGMAQTILMMHDNIGETTEFLKKSADLLLAKQMVPIEELQVRQKLVSLDEWLTVNKGFYVQPLSYMTLFKQELVRLLDVIIAHEAETVGVYAASWRQMRNFYIGLQSLLVSLVTTSHECLKA
jgi:hypothetical protein